MDSQHLLAAEGLQKKYCRSLRRSMVYGLRDIAGSILGRAGHSAHLRKEEFWAVNGVSLQLAKGECLGVIGANGSGKSTLLKMAAGVVYPDAGSLGVRGRVGSLIEIGAGFHPMLSGRENIYVNGAILGLGKREIDRKFDAIVEFAAIGEFLDSPVKFYSSGMYVRLGYAIAVHTDPDLLLVDEILAVGDAAFQRKCLTHMRGYLDAGGAILLVAHNMYLIQAICSRCLVLDQGQPVYLGNVDEGVQRYFDLQAVAPGARQTNLMVSAEQPARVTGIEIAPLTGGVLRSGGGARIAIRYRALPGSRPVAWGFSIWTQDQTVRIATLNSAWDGVLVSLREEGELVCLLPELPLVPGNYVLKAGLYDADTSWPIDRLGWEDPPVPFAMEGKLNRKETVQRMSADLLQLANAKWRRPDE